MCVEGRKCMHMQMKVIVRWSMSKRVWEKVDCVSEMCVCRKCMDCVNGFCCAQAQRYTPVILSVPSSYGNIFPGLQLMPLLTFQISMLSSLCNFP